MKSSSGSAWRTPSTSHQIRAAVQAPADAPAATGPDDEPALRDVAGLWGEVLGVREADPDDDFSDLGGTSRQALSLLRRVRLDLGVDVPVQEFALAPTLRGLAQAVVAARSADVAAVPVLRPGRGRPVFFVPDAWGQLNLYAGLVAALDTDRPVLGLHLPLVDSDGRHKSIDEVAAEALAAVREAQPDGPYSLIGYSFGGLVAFEMAVALRHEGEQVPYLGLLDVRPPEAALSRREIARRRWTARVRSVMTGQAVAAVGRRLRGTRQPDQPLPGRTPDAEFRFFQGSEQVSDAYRPGRFDGAVTYYLAEGSRPALGRILSAWRRRARRMDVVAVPGHHGDIDDERIGMLSERHVATLAARVSATLA